MIRFEHLTAGYDGLERLHGVTGALPEGRLTALIGPNGCGKTTLIKCLAGVKRPAGGAVFLNETPYRAISRRTLAQKVAYMPQSRPAPDMTVYQLAAHGRYPHLGWGRSLTGADRKIVGDALLRSGAEAFADRSVTALSGGERQRAYLAMMLAQQAQALLLDEPTAYLDPAGQFDLMELLRGLCSEGRTVVAVLHDLALAMEYADHLLLMDRGRMLKAGSPEEICASGMIDAVFGVKAVRAGDRYVFSRIRE